MCHTRVTRDHQPCAPMIAESATTWNPFGRRNEDSTVPNHGACRPTADSKRPEPGAPLAALRFEQRLRVTPSTVRHRQTIGTHTHTHTAYEPPLLSSPSRTTPAKRKKQQKSGFGVGDKASSNTLLDDRVRALIFTSRRRKSPLSDTFTPRAFLDVPGDRDYMQSVS